MIIDMTIDEIEKCLNDLIEGKVGVYLDKQGVLNQNARVAIQAALLDFQNRTKEIEAYRLEYPYNLFKVITGEDLDIIDNVNDIELQVLIEDRIRGLEYAISKMDSIERRIIEMRYERHMTLTDVGDELGIRREMVRQKEARVIRKLRGPIYIKYIECGYNRIKNEIEKRIISQYGQEIELLEEEYQQRILEIESTLESLYSKGK